MEKLHPVGNTVPFENERVRVRQVDLGSGEELSCTSTRCRTW
jgi:hypothetical protein